MFSPELAHRAHRKKTIKAIVDLKFIRKLQKIDLLKYMHSFRRP